MNEKLEILGQDILTELYENQPTWLTNIYGVDKVGRGDDDNWVVAGIEFNVDGRWVYVLNVENILNAMREIIRVNLLGPAAQAMIAQALTDESYANLDDSERLVSDIAQVAAFGEVRYPLWMLK